MGYSAASFQLFLRLDAVPRIKDEKAALVKQRNREHSTRFKADLCFLIVLSPVPPAVDPPLNFSFCRQE